MQYSTLPDLENPEAKAQAEPSDEMSDEIDDDEVLCHSLRGVRTKKLVMEANVFGGVILSWTNVEQASRVCKCHIVFLALSAFVLQALFILYMIPEISKNEYIGRIEQTLPWYDWLWVGERVCTINRGMWVWETPWLEIPIGTCGEVVGVHEAEKLAFFHWDIGTHSSVDQENWQNTVRVENISLHKAKLTEETNIFRGWRGSGVDGDEQFGGMPAAQFVCEGNDVSYLQQMVETLANYNAPTLIHHGLTRGALFGLISLFLWTATLVVAIRKALTFALFAHPDLKLDINKTEDLDEALPILLGLGAKLGLTFIFLTRILLLLALCFYGVKFLSHTVDLKDFILNSIALSFVIDIPELLFNAFGSTDEHEALTDFSETYTVKLDLPKWIPYCSGPCLVALAILIVFAGAWTFLLDFAWKLNQDVYRQLCAKQAGDTSEIFS